MHDVTNEILILSRISHKNFAKLLGVCLEAEDRLYSVFDSYPMGTLHENLFNGCMPWDIRLKVASEIAWALTYLHCLVSDPIVHRDIKPSCVHLDADFTAKISDFEMARFMPSGQCHVSTGLRGSPGYLDPDYGCTMRLTCKSDVFSFGVILVQLLTRLQATDHVKDGDPISLVGLFFSHVKERDLEQIFDHEVVNEDTIDQMRLVAGVATKCLEFKSEDRLTAGEVAIALEQLKGTKSSISVHDDAMEMVYGGASQAQSSCSASSSPDKSTGGAIYSKFLRWVSNRQKTKFQTFIKDYLKDSLKRYKMYTMNELRFDSILSTGKNVVYKGILPNGNLCAIKMSIGHDSAEEIQKEVNFLSRLKHRNIVELLGFCTGEKYPIVVYEYMANGSLSWHIQKSSIQWKTRLKISCEIARALSYLHTSLSSPIIHGDIKASNILLDDDYTAKLSDFGLASIFGMNNVNLLPIYGTPGYIDPEYLHTGYITCKSDVYSFGVVLAQLLTGKKEIFHGDDCRSKTVAEHFTWFMENNLLEQIIDKGIIDETLRGQIYVVAGLALKCLSLTKQERPSMIEVAIQLEQLLSGTLDDDDIV